MASFATAFGTDVTDIVVWLALPVLAVSAFTTLTSTGRRDRHGFVDPSALRAIFTITSGPIIAAAIVSLPFLMAISASDDTRQALDRLSEQQVGQAWVWVATGVTIFWLYALASTIVVTCVYYRQQRRLRTEMDRLTRPLGDPGA